MDINPVLEELDTFADDKLWRIVNRRLSSSDEERLHFLGSEEKRDDLTSEEQNEFDLLLAQVNHDMRMRSKALMLLQERGHDITGYLQTGMY